MTVEEQKTQAMARATRTLDSGSDEQHAWSALSQLWDEAFEAGRLAALDELQDRFCVCTK